MQKYNSFVEIGDSKGPWLGLLQITLFCFGWLVLFQLFALAPLVIFSDLEPALMGQAFSGENDDPIYKVALYLTQGVGSIGAFILAPLFYISRYQNGRISDFFFFDTHYWQPIVYTVLITISFMVVNSLFIEWNLSWKFPEFMSGFEQWALAKEEELKRITDYLTDFSGPGELMIAMLVIAVVPAVGEELLFRGLIQTRINRIVRNPHLAIWIAAILFSAFHMQFYGFVPRVLLGALFGYLFYWSGSLVLAMVAHFVNNGFSLIMVYLHRQGTLDFNIDDTESVPLETVTFFFIIGAILTFFLIRFYQKIEKADG